jgi:glycosyltransferase involved in cell wall biosynthesis
MSETLISCIVPAHNGERYLCECLDSIVAQTYRPLEIIVVDDGSTDGTGDIARGYGNGVRHLRQPWQGLSIARNRGVEASRGEFIAFLDHDDLWHSTKLKLQMARFRARLDLTISVTHVQNFWSPELEDTPQNLAPRHLKPLPGYVAQSLLTRRAVIDRIGLFHDGLKHASELDWFIRARAQGEVIELMADVLVYRRLHRNNASQLSAAASLDEHLAVIKASLDRRRRQGEGS